MSSAPDDRSLADQVRAHDLRLGSLIRNNPLPIVMVDRDRCVQMCNPAFEQLFQWGESEIQGRVIDEVLATSDTRGEFASLARTAAAARQSHMTTMRRRKDGSFVEVDLHIVPVVIDGESFGAYAIYRDLTTEREAARQVEEAQRMKTDFVSFVTHQLRTPLSGIKWMLELASETTDVAESASYVQDARESADRLIDLVNDLLDISRLESGKLQVALQPVFLAGMTRGVLADIKALVHEKAHVVTLDVPAAPRAALADPQLLRQVVLNLLSNAIKYTPSGGAIVVTLAEGEAMLRWSVRDSGIGIPKAQQARLFEKFFRADNAHTVDTEGTGLGLYLVRLIVERLGGNVTCESEEGQGTEFAFTVPIAAQSETAPLTKG
jgi:PAS domain S-box-containing protein